MIQIEDAISDTRQLKRMMRDLEEDQAIRIEGKMTAYKGGFIFVGTHGGKYQINLCSRIRRTETGKYTVGERNEWHQFETLDHAWRFVKPLVKSPLKAWIY